MKKLLLIAFVGLTVASCKKELVNPNNQTNSENFTLNSKTGVKTDSKYHVWHDDGHNDFGCWDTGGNCAHTTTVTGTLFTVVDNVFATIYTRNNLDIRNAFSNNSQVLKQCINPIIVDAVINGTYTVTARGTNPSQIRYMLFTNANGIQSVSPFD
ncbi:hypothetical protein BH10BAC1_BH10BAC1_08680 [soil metagenome]